MIVDRIYQYLNSEGKTFNAAVLEEALGRYRYILQRQLMQDREEKPGYLYVTRFTHPCARKGAYAYHGFEAEELQPRAKLTFLIGDAVELALVATAKMAGCRLDLNNDRVELNIGGYKVGGYIDGLFSPDGKELWVAEFKSMSPYSFKSFQKEGYDDTWGYVSQINAYMKALDLKAAIVVGLDKQTGALHEQTIKFDPVVWEGAEARAMAILQSTPAELPPRAILPELAKGSKVKLGLQCGYCQYKQHCWPEAELDTSGRSPVWYLPKEAMDEEIVHHR